MITGPSETVKKARRLRSEMTVPERILWRELRKRPGGLKFRRQHAADKYVLDFYCAKARLAIEVDGWAHDCEATIKRDKAKSAMLRSQGVATTRIPAKLILDDVEPVVTRLVEICRQRTEKLMVPLHQPAAGPPPRIGED